MKVSEMTKNLKEFVEHNRRDLFGSLHIDDGVPVTRSEVWGKNVSFADDHGLYFFADLNEEVLYVGKAQDTQLKGRVWDHIGTPAKTERVMFPDAWKPKSRGIKPSVESLIQKGDFKIYTLRLSDPMFSDILEAFALTLYWRRNNRKLPELNQEF